MRIKRQHPNGRKRRPGVILLIVVAYLAMLSIIGFAFGTYADAESSASRYSREAKVLALNSLDLSKTVHSDLFNVQKGMIDFSESEEAIEQYESQVKQFKGRICQDAANEKDPKTRESLESMCDGLRDICGQLETLRAALEAIESQSQ